MKKHLIILIVGVVLLVLGLCLNLQYEGKGVLVEAVVTDIDTTKTSDGEYRHVCYGEYEVDGKTYTKKLTTLYSSTDRLDSLSVGDTYEMRISPDNPGKKMLEGGFFGVVGLVMAVWGGVSLRRDKKALQQA